MANEFARRYADQGILSVSVNPGMYFRGNMLPFPKRVLSLGCIKTNINRHMGSLVQFVFVSQLPPNTYLYALMRSRKHFYTMTLHSVR